MGFKPIYLTLMGFKPIYFLVKFIKNFFFDGILNLLIMMRKNYMYKEWVQKESTSTKL